MSTNTVQPTSQANGVQKFSENTVDGVLKRINEFTTAGGVKLPPNYSAENAVRFAWLLIQQTKNLDNKPALTVCTKESIANALLDMVLQGLNPVKKQCYFIVYGDQLQLQRSYIGRIAVGKRVAGVKEIRAVPIYEKDEFQFEINHEDGRKKVTRHVQDFENIDPQNVKGAYAIIKYLDGSTRTEIMNMKQIRASWEMGKAKGNSPAHKNFGDEMSCKTVIARALKIDIDSTDDAALFGDDMTLEKDDAVTAHVKHQIAEHANKTELSIDGEPGDEQADYEEVNNEMGVDEETKPDVPEVEPVGAAKQTQSVQAKAPF